MQLKCEQHHFLKRIKKTDHLGTCKTFSGPINKKHLLRSYHMQSMALRKDGLPAVLLAGGVPTAPVTRTGSSEFNPSCAVLSPSQPHENSAVFLRRCFI